MYLDTNRHTLLDYKEAKHDGKDIEADPDADYSHSIKRALAKCEAAIEKRAMLGGLNATMSIFTLKNNYGWRDRTEQDVNTTGEVKHTYEELDDEQLEAALKARENRISQAS